MFLLFSGQNDEIATIWWSRESPNATVQRRAAAGPFFLGSSSTSLTCLLHWVVIFSESRSNYAVNTSNFVVSRYYLLICSHLISPHTCSRKDYLVLNFLLLRVWIHLVFLCFPQASGFGTLDLVISSWWWLSALSLFCLRNGSDLLTDAIPVGNTYIISEKLTCISHLQNHHGIPGSWALQNSNEYAENPPQKQIGQ